MAVKLKSNGTGYCMSVLIVGPSAICEKLSAALHEYSKKQEMYKLLVHSANRVQDVVLSDTNTHVDFVVFWIDTSNTDCLDKLEQDISKLDIDFTIGRMCFVHGSDVKPGEMAVSYNAVWDLKKKYSVYLLAGNTTNEAKCFYLAGRILKLMSAVSGVYSGIPYIDCHCLPKEDM
ncbi:hypothetical protein ANN_12243 [Periplaneta americana]|uniref:Centromere protein M n=1 Tax=Periplaneta americana TaxID=6978 RepID=A0ABQ8TI56_PERAM|nr:hypothetical protein ANN_12243 [Periplaneta americana]